MPRCQKFGYEDEIAAKLALAKVRRTDGSRRPKLEQRAYKCDLCRFWHLTSKLARRGAA